MKAKLLMEPYGEFQQQHRVGAEMQPFVKCQPPLAMSYQIKETCGLRNALCCTVTGTWCDLPIAPKPIFDSVGRFYATQLPWLSFCPLMGTVRHISATPYHLWRRTWATWAHGQGVDRKKHEWGIDGSHATLANRTAMDRYVAQPLLLPSVH